MTPAEAVMFGEASPEYTAVYSDNQQLRGALYNIGMMTKGWERLPEVLRPGRIAKINEIIANHIGELK